MQLLTDCTANKDVVSLIKIEKGLTISRAIEGVRTHQMIKIGGEKATTEAYAGAIIMTCEFFNVKPPMTEFQAVQTAILLVEQYPHETFEDFILCLKKAKLGEYGAIFNRIDGNVIFEWFRHYLNEKYQVVEDMKHNESQTINGKGEVSKEFKKNIQMVLKTIEKATIELTPTVRPGRNARENFEMMINLVENADSRRLSEMKELFENGTYQMENARLEKIMEIINSKLQAS